MRMRSCVVAATIHALLFAPLALANQSGYANSDRDLAALNRVLKLGLAKRSASPMTREQFEARRAALLKALDDQIRRIGASKMDDEAFRRRAMRHFQTAMKRLSKDTAKQIRGRLSAKQAQAVLDDLRAVGRYEDQIAMFGSAPEAVAACVQADLQRMASAVEREWQHYGKADFVRALRTRRAKLTSMTYDEGRYDEFFEGTWRLLASRDALEMIVLPVVLVIDVVCIPFVIWIKIINYWWPEE